MRSFLFLLGLAIPAAVADSASSISISRTTSRRSNWNLPPSSNHPSILCHSYDRCNYNSIAAFVAQLPRGGQSGSAYDYGSGSYQDDGYQDDYGSSSSRQNDYRDDDYRDGGGSYYDDYYDDHGGYDDRGRSSSGRGDDRGSSSLLSSMPDIIKKGDRKIGTLLLGSGLVFTMLGISLFFNKTLMRFGNLLFIAGVPVTIGPGRTAGYFFQPKKSRATGCLAAGILLVFIGYPVLGILLEAFGLLNLFGNMFPVVMVLLKQMPFIGPLLNQKKNNKNDDTNDRRPSYDDDDDYYYNDRGSGGGGYYDDNDPRDQDDRYY